MDKRKKSNEQCNIKCTPPKNWWERLKRSWGFCTCGGTIHRVHPNKAECGKCHTVFDVNKNL